MEQGDTSIPRRPSALGAMEKTASERPLHEKVRLCFTPVLRLARQASRMQRHLPNVSDVNPASVLFRMTVEAFDRRCLTDCVWAVWQMAGFLELFYERLYYDPQNVKAFSVDVLRRMMNKMDQEKGD